MIEMYENFSNECEKLRKEKEMTSRKETLRLPKDIICHLGTFVEGRDLINFFLISKTFNDHTNKNYYFWQRKLLKDFNFSYDSIYELSIIQQHYQILYQAKMFGISKIRSICPMFKGPNFKTIEYFLINNREKFTLRCQYVFSRGKFKDQKCDAMGDRYEKYIFCSQCIKKLPVQRMIGKNYEQILFLTQN